VVRQIDSLSAQAQKSATDLHRRSASTAVGVLDFEDDADFDRLTRMVSAAFGVPMSAIGLPVGKRVRFRARRGLEFSDTVHDGSFCSQVLAPGQDEALVVKDAADDARFSDNALVTEQGIRFYAGTAVMVHGERVGTLCAFDIVPHATVPKAALEQLAELAAVAGSLFELKDEARVRARTAAELIKEEWRHALTLEAGKVGSWVWDIRSGDVAANDILRRMFGFDPIRSISVDEIFAAVASEDRAALDSALEEAFEDGTDFVSEYRVKSGRWLIARGRVYQRDATGKPLIMMGVNIDITDAREAADHTRHLLRELNHRVKNTLAMIQSLARQTVRKNPDPKDFIEAFSGRLRTLSEAHALLSDRNWSGIGLVELIQSQVGPYLIERPDALVIEGEDVQLPPDHALGLGLILHELSSNAIRYGALSNRNGKVTIGWTQIGGSERQLELNWTESGGPPVIEPKEPGFGSQLIRRSLDKILDSHVTLEFPGSGVEARIALPLK
jgi:PAS domain S-box-containing protein